MVVCVLEILAMAVVSILDLEVVVIMSFGGSVGGCLITASLTETTLEVLLASLLSLTALKAM